MFMVKWHLTQGWVIKIFRKVTNTCNQSYPWKALKYPWSGEHMARTYWVAFQWDQHSIFLHHRAHPCVLHWASNAIAGWCIEAVFCRKSLLVFFQPSTSGQTHIYSTSRRSPSPLWSALVLCPPPAFSLQPAFPSPSHPILGGHQQVLPHPSFRER